MALWITRFLGRERRRGIELGLKRGLEKGLEQGLARGSEQGLEHGRLDGERHILLQMIARRFGRVPAAARKRIDEMTSRQLSALSAGILTAKSLNDLLG